MPPADIPHEDAALLGRYVRRHLAMAWTGLLVFLTLGIALEALHAFKAPLYLDVRNETRRLMWTLCHAHGTLLSLVQLAFALTVRSQGPGRLTRGVRFAGVCLTGALVALPSGFLLGGVWIYAGDPGPGIVGVPLGAAFLLLGVASMVLSLVGRSGRGAR